MDSSQQSSIYIGGGTLKGSYTPRTRQSSASSAMTSMSRKSMHGNLQQHHHLHNKKGPGSGRYSLSGRSNQSTQIVTRSENNIVESYGLPLPVLVNEALTFAERNTVVSINCSSNGWAWAVCGRRLLVWQYKETSTSPKLDSLRTPQRRAATGQCRELTLPHCDIGHKASLMTVFMPEGQQMASCLAISPTGDVRYWPSIAHDGSSIEENGILEGQEFDELVNISPTGYLLGTTTCNLVLLQLQLNSGRHTIAHRSIRPPSGFLGGIGKKFASILIGMNSQPEKENKFIKICAEKSNKSEWSVTVLADRWIQRWILSGSGQETFVFEDYEIFRKIRDAFHQKLWSNRDSSEVEIRLLDMQTCDGKICILAAAINVAHTPQIYYALAIMSESGPGFSLSQFCQIKHSNFYTGNASTDNITLKFILYRNIAYVYDDRVIYQVYLNAVGNDDTEKIEFPAPGDKIMAAAIYQNIPLFFSRLYGLVCISPADFESAEYFNSSISSEAFGAENPFLSQHTAHNDQNYTSLSMYDFNPEEIYNSDHVSQLKAAFIYHLKKNTAKCNGILAELLDGDVDNEIQLDPIVLTIARDLAEDIPAADPRWEQIKTNKHALGSSASMQIIQQLKEKKLAFNHFIDFLHTTELWNRLTTVNERGNIKPTGYALADINEKIIAAIALKRIHTSNSKLLDDAIQIVLQQRNEHVSGNLTPQDLFYVKVTKIHEIFKVLSKVNEENIQTEQSTSRISSALNDINAIVLAVLADILKFRESKVEQFAISQNDQQKYEYLPWTAESGKNGLRDILSNLISATLKHGARSTGEPELRQKHYRQLVELVDFVLDGRKSYLESIKDSEKYGVYLQQFESQRSDLIYPFVDDGQYELATKLAEKYLDFQVLVQICDRTENQGRLDEYIEKYKELNFSQFAINWHLRQNKRGDLFERFKRNQADLAKFLGDHPSLAWVQSVFNGDLTKAAKVLYMLAQNETELVARKRTILSLAKLTSLAADADLSVQIANINADLQLITYQENISEHLLNMFGYDIVNPKVLKAEEIINLLIAEENESATEDDYRKSLELLSYVDDAVDVRHKIWFSAILRDAWTTYNINAPQEDLQKLMFFKLIDLCLFMDADIDLPPIEIFLEAPELGHLTQLKSFQFLLKLGYEHLFESYKRK